jgi:hypothetical protein
VDETVTIVRQIYDANGRPSPPVMATQSFTVLPPTAGDETRYDVYERLALTPGRYELRLNTRSAVAGRDGSVFLAFEVPDVERVPISLTGVALGSTPTAAAARTDVLAAILPIVPTSARSFTGAESVSAYFRVFQGGNSAATPVIVRAQIFDRRDQPVFDVTETLAADAFAAGRGVAQQVALPLSELAPGPYLLSITAARAVGPPVRKDVRFSIR